MLGAGRVENSIFYADWKKPIVFYGRVVDENMRAVPDASIHFSWMDTSPTGMSQSDTRSDTNGLFGLAGVTGRLLSVSLNKPGYYVSKRERKSFDYSPNFALEVHQPDPNNPVVFHLRKKGPGADLITSRRGVFPDLEISGLTDGSPVQVNFLSRQAAPDGQLELSAVKPPRGQPAARWSFRMSIPDGGFVEQNDEFPFEAPESGYIATIEFDFRAGDTNWTQNLRKRYYIVFGEPPKYGWIDVATGTYRGVSLSYAINPDGSRYLEPR